MLDTHARKWVQPGIETTARSFLKAGFTPNGVTVAAFIIGGGTGIVYYTGFPILAVLLLWVSGFLDAVDGSMARLTKPSPFGTVMDVTFDRIVEISVILGVAAVHPEAVWPLLLLSVSIIISMTIFLTVGAVSEKEGGKSFYYQAGLAERTEGFILFSLMMLFPSIVVWTTLLFVAVELYTGFQRFAEAKRLLS
ncbi:CDP-alcohol phosphatidyltransferase family protein [Rossellomorea marisflavi]|uniref:CDP-alcohol phosphatidyltransferase family protein n=1 Tax=Rossellomorea marisflavi TaxID=189381 RepID=UPI00064EC306|nr:CDP-alcohol phosphatidyltransferase family protein [Rossellomorea marisflavi]KMK91577.1 CDP-alcohol phosphatidyltransferase [Rossellomorea marisflavi]KML01782.1 CDP-alcohol phosphatidyltransferase [Rossellomorea marisflavi]KML33555.1 CDP-alcohol phosphatidyltransferase [Rossellomorea marisflavi]QHA34642.1 CDP-alcohol phosphatidyltransferase family protein [Rossellomorea marisflavi]TYO70857.1 CDP-alcohol phosphatidyltransferase family protein [Rossellomorea marisflavi]